MKELNNEELINNAIPDSDHTVKYKAELLTRLNRLTLAEATIQAIWDIIGDIEDDKENRIETVLLDFEATNGGRDD